ncbi:phosphoribosylglycinamide synthetase, C domain protein [Mycobacterium xenopi 4042]|uniref:Phosphoribosylglycinamide synthetase, C domain protein n=1 Tax=Mycobacterium xenopi 4042 TaxID=1299334 RepID=X8CXD3_MYCXE|nr:phosphoribosylglycinamide synthetase, C domain protein [Mycobacterium xenopi 4042]
MSSGVECSRWWHRPDLAAARSAAYHILDSIKLPGGHFRSDIGLLAAEGKIHV